MSSSRKRGLQQKPTSRRERREAERRAARGVPDPQSGGLPIAWLTAGVVAVVVIVIAALIVLRPTPAGTASTSSPGASSPVSSPAGTASASSPAGSGAPATPLDTSWVVKPDVLTPAADASGRQVGSAAAPVKLDVWADFQCPVCKQFTEVIEPQIVSNYISTGKARLVFHDLAFIGRESTQAALGGLCAADQDRFWPYHDYVYANQGAENSGALSDDRLEAIAQAAGLDVAAFTSCLVSGTHQQDLQAELQQAQQLGLRGTPTLFVNDRELPSALDYPSVAAAIDAALASAPTSPAP